MTLRSQHPDDYERAQASAVQIAGGVRMEGSFGYTEDGWRLTLEELSFQELVRVVGAVRRALE